MNVKGLHDMPTPQGATGDAATNSRARLVTRLFHLEYERSRLEKELAMWLANRLKAERRLKQVREGIEHLSGLLWLSPSAPGASRDAPDSKRARPHAGAKGAEIDGAQDPTAAQPQPSRRREVPLEY